MALMAGKIGYLTGTVNGRNAGCTAFNQRSSNRSMDWAAVLRRIEERLTAVRLSADAASRLAQRPDAIRNLRRALKGSGRVGLTASTLQDLAAVLETTAGWLMDGTAEEAPANDLAPGPHPRSIRVAGKVAAGVFREVIEDEERHPEYIFDEPDEEFPHARQMAFDVEGDSLNRLQPRPILEGDTIVCVDFDDTGLPLVEGMVIVLQRTKDDGQTLEWSAKQVEIQPGRTEFHARSDKTFRPIVIHDDPTKQTTERIEVIGLVRRASFALARSAPPRGYRLSKGRPKRRER